MEISLLLRFYHTLGLWSQTSRPRNREAVFKPNRMFCCFPSARGRATQKGRKPGSCLSCLLQCNHVVAGRSVSTPNSTSSHLSQRSEQRRNSKQSYNKQAPPGHPLLRNKTVVAKPLKRRRRRGLSVPLASTVVLTKIACSSKRAVKPPPRTYSLLSL